MRSIPFESAKPLFLVLPFATSFFACANLDDTEIAGSDLRRPASSANQLSRICDPVTQPRPHYGLVGFLPGIARYIHDCKASCGAAGGTLSSDAPCDTHPGFVSADGNIGKEYPHRMSYDTPYCCVKRDTLTKVYDFEAELIAARKAANERSSPTGLYCFVDLSAHGKIETRCRNMAPIQPATRRRRCRSKNSRNKYGCNEATNTP